MTRTSTYTVFRTDVPNILGGYNTYSSLSEAIKWCRKKVYARTKVKKENRIGIDTGSCLSKLLWEDLVYEKK